MIPSRVTRDRVDTLIPWMMMRSTPSHLAKENGHRVLVIGVSSAVEHISHETAMHARAEARNRLAQANRASHGPRVSPHTQAKGKSKENKEISKGKSKGTKSANQGAKGVHKGNKSKTGLSDLEHSKSEASSETQESAQTCTTDTSWNDSWSLMNGLMYGTKVGNKRMTLPQAHFRLEDSMSVPPAVRSG